MLSELKRKIIILIPALNPKKEFIKYINELIDRGFKKIVIVNDGSKEECEKIFEEIELKKECTIIKHDVNKGKGKSLKDGLEYVKKIEDYKLYAGIITADCDGQHLVKDVIKIADKLEEGTESLILGSRNFEDGNVPGKSSMGNRITSAVFKLLYGVKIADTQTGLRGIPVNLVDDFINIAGNRYEYETNMLINCILNKIEIIEIPITTVYIDNNSNTHFRPVIDSISIYCKILNSFMKYSVVSIISFAVDIVIFKLFLALANLNVKETDLIVIATIFARIISSLVNYTLNKKVTFNSNKKISNTIVKYYALCIIQMIVSGVAVAGIFNIFGQSEVIIKIIVDTILFLVNYRVQRKWIFNS